MILHCLDIFTLQLNNSQIPVIKLFARVFKLYTKPVHLDDDISLPLNKCNFVMYIKRHLCLITAVILSFSSSSGAMGVAMNVVAVILG